jgi:hypothetical protein
MALDLAARLRETDLAENPVTHKTAALTVRRHVLNRTTQEKSGRLYCSDDWDFEIPSLEIYAAR